MQRDILFASCLGLGKLPWAPGTWGALPPVVVYQVLGYLAPTANVPVMAAFLLSGVWAYVTFASSAWERLGPKKAQVVADCWAGQSLAMLMIALWRPVEICNSMALGFALFRLLDATIPTLGLPWSPLSPVARPLLQRLATGAVAGGIALMIMGNMPQYFD